MLAGGLAIAWNVASKAALADDEAFAKGIEDVPFATTRGLLAKGYEVVGAIPGFSCPPARDIFIVIHGLNNNESKAENRFALARESLRRNGYQGTVIGWSWDGATNWDPFGATGYRKAKENAIANGPLLRDFLLDLSARNPSAKVRLLGYSMGARVALEGLSNLPATAKVVTSVHLVGAAIDNEEVEIGERYGACIEDHAGQFFNYFRPGDDKLGTFFPVRDADRALGQVDIEHPSRAPKNYRFRNVASELKSTDSYGRVDPTGEVGKNHSGYLGIRDDSGTWQDDGAINVVAKDIEL